MTARRSAKGCIGLAKSASIMCALLMCCAWLASCSLNEMRFTLGEERYREAKLETILDALQNEDANAIARLFSRAAVTAAGKETLEEGIEYLFTVYEGNFVSYEMKGGSPHQGWRGAKRVSVTTIRAVVTTDAAQYYVECPDYLFNTFERGGIGITSLQVMTMEDVEKYGYPRGEFFGIYHPGWRPEQIEYGTGIEHQYETGFGNFTVPVGYYWNRLRSMDERYVFYDDYNEPADPMGRYFSIEEVRWDGNANNADSKRGFIDATFLEFQTFAEENLPNPGMIHFETPIESVTEQGYILIEYAASNGSEANTICRHYILGDRKYVLLNSLEWSTYPDKMHDAARAVADSFVWAE